MSESYFRDLEWKGVVRAVSSSRKSFRELLGEFAQWLRSCRAMEPGTVRNRVAAARDFLEGVVRNRDVHSVLPKLTAGDIETFFMRFAEGSGYARSRSMRAGLRRLLLFAAEKALVDRLLVDSVPRLRTYRLSDVPRGIDDQQILQLLSAMPDVSPTDIRDRAMVLMLAVYGIRRGQLRKLRLEHVKWADRRIHFPAHKGGKPVVHTLVGPVASALARYIKEVRPSVPYREVFLRLKIQPYVPLNGSSISTRIRTRLLRAGISTHKKGAHLFRHAFATRLLRAGRPLKTIADLLGHRHLESAAIYAKVDHSMLLEAAAEWPEVLQ